MNNELWDLSMEGNMIVRLEQVNGRTIPVTLKASSYILKLFDTTEDELVGNHTFWETCLQPDATVQMFADVRLLQTFGYFESEIMHKGKWLRVQGRTLSDTNIFLTVHEITSQHGETSRFIETANAPIFGINILGEITEWNPKTESITGYKRNEVIGTHLVSTYIDSEYQSSVDMVLVKALRGEQTDNYELRLRDASGSYIDLLLNATTRRDRNGVIIGVIGVGQDMTHIKALHKKMLALQTLTHNASDAIVILVKEGDAIVHEFVTDSMFSLCGHTADFIKAHTMDELVESDYFAKRPPDEIMHSIEEALQIGTVSRSSFMVLVRHGVTSEPCHIEVTMSTKDVAVILVCRNVNDRVARHALEIENTKLEIARTKDRQHMAVISHHMKNRFIGCTALAKNCYETVREHAPHLLISPHNFDQSVRQLNDQLQKGVRLCINQAVENELIYGTYTIVKHFIDVKATIFDAFPACNPPVISIEERVSHVKLDDYLLGVVLDNVVSNAIRHGSTAIPVFVVVGYEDGMLTINMTNSSGANHSQMRELHESKNAFANIVPDQIHMERSCIVHSTGFGKYILQKCLNVLDGTIGLFFKESSVLTSIRVPCNLNEIAQSILPKNLTFACLDDDPLSCMIIEDYMKRFKANERTFIQCPKTEGDIDKFKHWVLTQTPDIVIVDQFLDCGVYQALGTTIIQNLRECKFTNICIIRSASDSSDDRELYLESGANGSLPKHLSQSEVASHLSQILEKGNMKIPYLGLRNRRCLVIDDDIFSQEVIKSVFQLLGSSYSHAIGTTIEELNVVQSEKCLYDLIILDQLLEYAGESRKGTDIARCIRNNGYGGKIFLHTGLNARELESFDLSSVDAVIYKSEKLSMRIQELFQTGSSSHSVDYETLRAVSPKARGLLPQLFSEFDSFLKTIEVFEDLDEVNHTYVRKTLHRYKGSFGAFGIIIFRNTPSTLEMLQSFVSQAMINLTDCKSDLASIVQFEQ